MNVLPENCIQCTINRQYNPLRQSVVDTVNTQYKDAYVTAHLEVPGEMFQIALEKSLKDEGVVGSTSNILQFIERKVQEAAKEGDGGGVGGEKKKFILGTEAGMVTSIARSVQHILDSNACQNVEAEIIFPVSSEAVMGVENDGSESNNNNNNTQTTLEVVPGVAGGEGCSTVGGCATCPFMKMNDLDAVHDIVDVIQSPWPIPRVEVPNCNFRSICLQIDSRAR
jgi:quinolinate synthase